MAQERPTPDFSTVRDWIGDLPEIAAGETDPEVPDHRAARLSTLNLKRIRATRQGGSNRDWPESLRLPCHQTTTGIHRRLRAYVVGPTRFRADYPMHQLFQWTLWAPRTGSCDQRPGSRMPADVPDGFPFFWEPEFKGSADRQCRTGKAGNRRWTPRCPTLG